MGNVLGVIGLIVYCACIIGLAAAITWLVIKISPAKDKPKATPEVETEG